MAFIGPGNAAKIGLVESWRRALSLPAGSQSIVDIHLQVHGNDPDSYIEIVQSSSSVQATPDQAKEVSPNIAASVTSDDSQPILARIHYHALAEGQLAAGGMIDRAEAERLARNEIRRLKRRGIVAQMRDLEVPRIRLYTLGDDGTVECRDAETGQLQWLQRVGRRSEGYTGIGVDDMITTVINGSYMIEIDNRDGTVIGELALEYVPLRGTIHANGYAVLPAIGPRIMGYPIADLQAEPFAEMVSGASLSVPAASLDSLKVAWGTANGFVYVMEVAGQPNVQFRLDTDGIVSGSPTAASGERFFFGSESGQLYGIRATRSGEVLWSRPTGQPIYQSPTVVDDKILFLSAFGNLMCVGAQDGLSVWDADVPGVRDVMGIIDNKIYLRKLSGEFVDVSLADGLSEESISGTRPEPLFFNRKTDRLYLVDSRGIVQCLRPIDGELPTITGTVVLETNDATAETAETIVPAGDPSSSMPNDSDPFGAGQSDPFGAGGADPFAPAGGNDDPFAPAAGGDDPFAPMGGEDDPFGNSPF